MSYNFSPRIVTDGLVLYLDGANSRSYPTTGTTWTDLSRSGFNGVLTNGPTFSGSNGGNIFFDGTNDFVVSPINLNQYPNVTFSAWVYTTRASTNCGIMGNDNNTYGRVIRSFGSVFEILKTTGVAGYSTSNIPLNQWFNITVSWSTSSVIFYLNVNQEKKVFAGEIAIYNDLTSTYFGSNGAFGQVQYLKGNLAQIMIYNRVVSEQEIQQNYNALKTRFI